MHWYNVRPSLLAILSAALLTACDKPAATDDESTRIDELFAHFDAGVQPGAAVLVIREGKVVYERGFGYADLANNVRIDENSSFRLASVSKQFTTTAIMVLVEAGKLHYDDLLADHISEFSIWPGVTLRHLMTHTSGIPDYYEKDYYADFDASDPMPSNGDIVEILSRYPNPEFAPGERYEYNNAAYEVLVELIERTSGESFADFVAERVFDVAGMPTATTFNSATPDIPNRVYGHEPNEHEFVVNDFDPFNDMLGAGGVYATLRDFYAWDQSLTENRVVSAETLRNALTPTMLNNGEYSNYGFGWSVGAYRGHASVEHSGSWVGFRTHYARYPEEELSVVVLSNRTDGNPGRFVRHITDIYLPEVGNTFLPDESQASAIAHHRRVPTDDHWWNVRGKEMGWLHRHVDQLFPTAAVYRNGPVSELSYREMDEIGNVEIETPDGPMPFRWFIESDHSTAMGVVILHEGKIVFESYPRMQEYEKPTYWSTTKVFAGTIVRILEERGLVDVSKPIDYYVPALANSVHAGTTIRNVLDMATGVDCTENYEDIDSCYYRYSMAIGENIRTDDAPDDPYEFMANVDIERTAPQGEKFVYSGGSNFLLMWLVEEITGYPYQDSISKEIWYHIGAENDAGFFAYRDGIAVSHGGFHSKMRDLARFGLLYTPSYDVVSKKKIISDAHLDLIQNGGRPELLRNAGNPADSPVKHNVYAWGEVYKGGFISHGGWGGQGLYIHPEKDVVAVFTSYFKQDFSEVSLQNAMVKVLDENFGGFE